MNYLTSTLTIGFAATAVMDIWGLLRKPLLGMPAADYRLVGRWISYFAHGRFRHAAIAKAPPAAGELATGWVAHYLLGLAFGAAFIALAGLDWLAHPTAWPALAFGVATVLVPFGVMQPAMGLGWAASRAPRPGSARLQSLLTHAVFGIGLYLGGWANHFINDPGV